MDYEKKYKEALERADTLMKKEGKKLNVIPICKYIFPEFDTVSKDERIRKAIHIYLDWLDGRKDYAPKGIYSIKDMIAWLEKQGEKKELKKIELKKLDADKVIAWLVANICDFEYYVKLFKKDFGL